MDDAVNSSILFFFLSSCNFNTFDLCLPVHQSLLSGRCVSTSLLSSDNMLMPLYYPFEM